MNNQEQKNIHDKLESIVNRSNKVSSKKNYLPITVSEFGKELYENKALESMRQDLTNQGKEYFIPLRITKDKVLHNFDQASQILRSHASKFPRVSSSLLKYDKVIKNNIPGSYTFIDQLEPLLRDAITEMSTFSTDFQTQKRPIIIFTFLISLNFLKSV